MDVLYIVVGIFLLVMLIGAIASYKVILAQQHTIDRLTDKLMARDYREYVTMQQRPTEPQKTMREPLSWHDDPSIEDEVAN